MSVSIFDALIKIWIGDVCVVIIITLLTIRIRRVSHDDPDIELLLAFAAVAVVGEEIADVVVLFVELEGVGEADAFEGLVFSADDAVIDGFDVDGGDVVGE